MEKRICEVCGKEIVVKKERLKKTKPSEFYYSEEGIYFEESNVWFCNDCWDEMTKHLFKEK